MATAGPVHFEIPCYSEFGVTMTWYVTTLTSSSGISLGGSGGTITISLTDVQTAAISPGFGVWDLELIDSGGSNLRLVEGTCEFTPSVTRN